MRTVMYLRVSVEDPDRCTRYDSRFVTYSVVVPEPFQHLN